VHDPRGLRSAKLFVTVAVEQLGVDNVRAHLLGASPQDWDGACANAGTSAAGLQTAFARYFQQP